MQLPDEFLRGVIGAELPPAGQYGVAVCFLPQEEERRHELERLLADTVEAEGQRVVTWRDIPVEKDYVGRGAPSRRWAARSSPRSWV